MNPINSDTDASPTAGAPAAAPPVRRRLRPRWTRLLAGGVVLLLVLPTLANCMAGSAPPPSDSDRSADTSSRPRRPLRLPPGADLRPIHPPVTSDTAAAEPPRPTQETTESATTYELTPAQADAVLRALAERGMSVDPTSSPQDSVPARPPVPAAQPGRTRVANVTAQDTVPIVLPVATRSAPLKTLVTFADEADLEDTVVDFPQSYLDWKIDGNTLHLRLQNREARGDIHIKGTTTRVTYRLMLSAGSAETGDYDGSVTLVLRSDPATGPHKPTQVEQLAMAMYQRAHPVGLELYDGGREIMYDHDGLRVLCLYVYESATHTGYVCQILNRRDGPWLVEKERFTGDGLILVGTEETTIPPAGSTFMYLIFQRDDDGD